MTLFLRAPNPNKPLMYGVTPEFFIIGDLLRGHVDAGYPGAPFREVYKEEYGTTIEFTGSPEYEFGTIDVFWSPASRLE